MFLILPTKISQKTRLSNIECEFNEKTNHEFNRENANARAQVFISVGQVTDTRKNIQYFCLSSFSGRYASYEHRTMHKMRQPYGLTC